ncbi:hypothetical protein [Streptomyces sp. NPDC058373]|uniref:hypothetical protein n=1 Tax=Streptomyces sp. NPDC058373 TaxID=3346465 RepID=UPI003660BA8F
MTTCRRSTACYATGCRNRPCVQARYRYEVLLHLDHARGQRRRIDATQTRVWINRLLAHGWNRHQIAAAAGVTHDTARRIMAGAPTTTRTTAAAIQGIRLAPPRQGNIDATGTRRRLQALACIGWTHDAIAKASGVSPDTIASHIYGRPRTIHADLARQIAGAYRRLVTQPGTSTLTRTRAAARGWHGPLAWDDIDNPACEPEAPTVPTELRTGRRSAVDADLVMELTAAGLSKQQIAWELGCTVRSVERVHNRRLVPAPAPAAIPAVAGA